MTSEYNMRYDRQVQIFGKNAQFQIEKSLLIIDSLTVTTSEILKNAVMSGFQVDLQFVRSKNCEITFNEFISHFPQKTKIEKVLIIFLYTLHFWIIYYSLEK